MDWVTQRNTRHIGGRGGVLYTSKSVSWIPFHQGRSGAALGCKTDENVNFLRIYGIWRGTGRKRGVVTRHTHLRIKLPPEPDRVRALCVRTRDLSRRSAHGERRGVRARRSFLTPGLDNSTGNSTGNSTRERSLLVRLDSQLRQDTRQLLDGIARQLLDRPRQTSTDLDRTRA